MRAELKKLWFRVNHDKSVASVILAIWLLGLILYVPVLNHLDGDERGTTLQVLWGFVNTALFVYSFLQWKSRSRAKKGNPRYVLWFVLLILNYLLVMEYLLSMIAWVFSAS